MTPSAFDNLFTEDIILKGNFEFVQSADYDSESIVAKHIDSGKMINIAYGKPLKEQLHENGLYLIFETNCYNETSSYLINYYDSCNVRLSFDKGQKDAKGAINAIDSITLQGLELEGNLNCYIRVTNKTTKQATAYTLEEFKNIKLGVGEYEIYCAVQFGGICKFNIVVKETKESPIIKMPNEPTTPENSISKSNQTDDEETGDDKNLFEKFVDKIGNVAETVVGGIGSAVNGIGNIFDSAIEKVKDFFDGLF